MTEQIEDSLGRTPYEVIIPHYTVVRTLPNPEGERCYCVNLKMYTDGVNGKREYAGWKAVSKGYTHSTSAYAAMGRLVQSFIRETHLDLPENQR